MSHDFFVWVTNKSLNDAKEAHNDFLDKFEDEDEEDDTTNPNLEKFLNFIFSKYDEDDMTFWTPPAYEHNSQAAILYLGSVGEMSSEEKIKEFISTITKTAYENGLHLLDPQTGTLIPPQQVIEEQVKEAVQERIVSIKDKMKARNEQIKGVAAIVVGLLIILLAAYLKGRM